MASRREMIELAWVESEEGSSTTAELRWFTIWIEPLDREGEGRYVWTLDTLLSSSGDELTTIDCSVEASYPAARITSAAWLAHHQHGDCAPSERSLDRLTHGRENKDESGVGGSMNGGTGTVCRPLSVNLRWP